MYVWSFLGGYTVCVPGHNTHKTPNIRGVVIKFPD
jgi:hypothetical protein